MWKQVFSHTYKDISPEKIWQIWTDVNNWHQWHDDLDYCSMKGPFEIGNYFMLKPKGIKAVKITLTDVKPGHQFTDCTVFFGAKMFDTHSMEQTAEGLKLTNTVFVTGPLKKLWVKLVAKNVADTAPNHIDALAQLARRKNA